MVERHLVWPRHGSAFDISRDERGSPFVSCRNDPNREPLRKLDGGEIDGLSSITYDVGRGVCYALLDDRGNRPAGDPVR